MQLGGQNSARRAGRTVVPGRVGSGRTFGPNAGSGRAGLGPNAGTDRAGLGPNAWSGRARVGPESDRAGVGSGRIGSESCRAGSGRVGPESAPVESGPAVGVIRSESVATRSVRLCRTAAGGMRDGGRETKGEE